MPVAAKLVAECARLGGAAAALEGCDDNGLDAFVCALVARAALAGLTGGPVSEQVEVARREGWIHVPTAGVAEIGACAASPPLVGYEHQFEGSAPS